MIKRRKMKIRFIVVLTILGMIFTLLVNSSVYAKSKEIYTTELAKGDKIEFTGTAWCVYKSDAIAQKVGKGEHPKVKKYLKNGKKYKIIAKNGNVLKIGNKEFIYYGSTANNYFKKIEDNQKETSKTVANKTSDNKTVENKTIANELLLSQT